MRLLIAAAFFLFAGTCLGDVKTTPSRPMAAEYADGCRTPLPPRRPHSAIAPYPHRSRHVHRTVCRP